MLQNSSDLYNGNIARMVTTITDPDSRAVLPLGNAYQYDQLNRLKHAVSFDQLNGNAWAGGAPAKYENSFTYDANGNILTQTRNDDNNQVIDELAYFYPKNAANKTVRNRLLYVSDNVDYDASDIDPGMSTSNYAYDQEGRLIQDLQEEIASIEWRVDGKVKRINRIANSAKQNLSFDYDAMGHRIAKHVYSSANVLEKSTYYVLDETGKQIAVYERNIDENTQSVAFQLTERTIYGTTRVGSLNKTMNLLGSAGTPTYVQATVNHSIGKRNYELANHLGSVITVVSDKVIPHPSVPVVTGSGGGGSTVDYWLADILQSTDYSPFGVQLNNRTLNKNGVTDFVRFGYQGSEMDNELKNGANSYTTYFRQLDPRLGRWMSLDPMVDKFPWQSPYCSMDNNPIWFNDQEGDSVGLEESFQKDKSSMKAMEEMVKSKEGRDFLAKYAKAGQTIAGYTFKEDGKYHLKGINLTYRTVNAEKWEKDKNGNPINVGKSGGGDTKKSYETVVNKINGEHVQKISQVNILVTVYTGKGWQTNNYTFNRIITLFHESFIHVDLNTKDFLDDGWLNESNMTTADKERASGISNHYQHKHVMNYLESGKTTSSSLWPNQAYSVFKSIAKEWNLGYSDEYIWKSMWNFSGGYTK